MARGRKRGSSTRSTPQTRSPEPEAEPEAAAAADLHNDDDDDDPELQEALRRSQLDSMNDEERRRRENEDLLKAIQLSLIASSSIKAALPSTSNISMTRSGANGGSYDIIVDSGQKRAGKSVRNKISITSTTIEVSDEENSNGSNNGCDSTIYRGRGSRGRGGRGRGRGRKTAAAVPKANDNVSSTRGKRGKKAAAAAADRLTEAADNVLDAVAGPAPGPSDAYPDLSSVQDAYPYLSSEDEYNEASVMETTATSDDDPDDHNWEEENACSSTTNNTNGSRQQLHQTHGGAGSMNNAEVAKKMKNLFESSLKLHLTGKYMEACPAIATKLYPHQMFALAWMCARENMKDFGMHGGILADDMGLGKTLSIISLVLTNFHDGKPLAKRQYGFRRKLERSALRYLPQSVDSAKFSRSVGKENGGGKRGGKAAAKKDLVPGQGLFDHLKSKGQGQRRKDMRQPVKSSRPRGFIDDSSDSDHVDDDRQENKKFDSSLHRILDNGDLDEFDAMCGESGSLVSVLGVNPEAEIEKTKSKMSQQHFDLLSDDEEYQNMTEEERNEKMKPKDDSLRSSTVDSDREADISLEKLNPNLNVDGALDTSSDSDGPCSSSTNKRVRGTKRATSSESKQPQRKKKAGTFDDNAVQTSNDNNGLINDDADDDINAEDLPDIDDDDRSTADSREDNGFEAYGEIPKLTAEQAKNLVIPPREVAQLNGRRRATLIVTPASLIGQWLSQIETHVSKDVNIEIFVHHGQSKSLLSLELQDKDIVLTTYGTLSSEFKANMHGPLLRAKWLRVVLDEGHQIKNHNSKTFKAASNLDTQRKWIVSGTPIQNNLTELWALLNWLGEPTYGENRPMFKHQIEGAIKRGHPRGVERLQLLLESICLRRTKSDEVDGKPLISLPTKIVTLKRLEFTEEEKTVYSAYHQQGRELILKYIKKGTLMRNFGHVFEVMMRLRQICCHKELLPIKWKDVDLKLLESMLKKEVEEVAAADDSEAGQKELAKKLQKMIMDGMTEECSICLSDLDQPVITPCSHVYCRPCIIQVIDTTSNPPAKCPLCRGAIKANLLLEAARDEETDDSESGGFEDIVVDVSSTKINAVLKELEINRRRNPLDKSIVVSQFTSLLSILQPHLNDAGYHWTRLDGSMSIRQKLAVIEDFQSKKAGTPTILLLSLRAGGVGLNLTAANRLYLLDPAWNPSTEEQCFDRIHRLGQTSNVEIVKFIMKDSIEERMLSIQDKKRDLISGAFRQTENERREQRIQDIREIFDL